jgi:tRNA-dihydrouridine synthase A
MPGKKYGRAHAIPLSVAPMMDRTDRHFRFFMRQMTKHTLLYTEMVTTGAVIRGHRERIIGYDPIEKPLALQLGGDDPTALAECARIAEGEGYDEVNLNVGCPSDRVQNGNFGACLMAQPHIVAEGVAAMRNAVKIPVTVKHRIGIDDFDSYEFMLKFVDVVAQAKADRFSVHARKALLQGLSPKDNRSIPPLRYEDIYRLKRERPDLCIEINGGIRSLESVQDHLHYVDGVMIGRAAYEDPYIFAEADKKIFKDKDAPIRRRTEIVHACLDYADAWVKTGGRLHAVSRHLLTLFARQAGARIFRRHISEQAPRTGSDSKVLLEALKMMQDAKPSINQHSIEHGAG